MTAFPFFVCGGALLAALFLGLSARRWGVPGRAAERTLLIALPLGAFLSHIFYAGLLANLELTVNGFGFLFLPWAGGHMFYGAVAGALIAVLLVTRGQDRQSRPRLMDLTSIALLLLIAAVRLGEPFDNSDGYGQGYGLILEDMELLPVPWRTALCFVSDPEYMDEWYLAVFAFEALWALVSAVWVWRGLGERKPGQSALLALCLYAGGTMLFEFLRQDYTMRWRFVRLSQLLSAILLAVVLLHATVRGGLRGKRAVGYWAGFLCCIGLVIAMEFADEKPLILSDEVKIFFPHWVTYFSILLGGAGAAVLAYRSHCRKPEHQQLYEAQ